ncbi:serine-aspartate repeat-containing protein I-like isoform X3 [Pimephales promelas]|uniref:serine-aspartate repeat-containing protein I-like isoform X3 n=1 Tax=Pimephales promelas TaxID=90988 RepID=UPI001955B55D|nr:serine-aspartate repeat-containing protein I-like isoform X3 [Pimephales promelas]
MAEKVDSDVDLSADSSPDTGDKDKDDKRRLPRTAENVTHSEPGSTIIEDKENVNNIEKRKIDNRTVATSETNKSKETEKAGDINERGDGLKDKDKANEMGEDEVQDRDRSSEAESKKLSTPSSEDVDSSADSSPDTGDKDKEDDNRIVATSETNKSKETEKARDINERGDGLKDKDKANEMGENEDQDRDTSSKAQFDKETPPSLEDVGSSADSSPDTGDKDKEDDTDKMTDSCLSAENVTHSEPGSTILKDKENVNNIEKRKIDNRTVATSETNKSKETEKARDINERGDGLKDKDKANEMGENEDQDRDMSSDAESAKETPSSLKDVDSSADSSPDTGDKDKEDDTDKMTDSCLSAENVTHSEPGSTIIEDKENVNNTEKRKIDNRTVATSETNKSKETEKAGDINERGDGLKDKDKANEMGENEVQDRDTSSDAESAKETPSSLKDVDSSADSSPDTGDKDKEDDKTRLPRTAENVTHSEPGSTIIEDNENVNNIEKRKIDNRTVATSETNKSKETEKARDINERGDGLKDKDKANKMGEDEVQDRDRSSEAESKKLSTPSLEDVGSSADSSPDTGDKDKKDDNRIVATSETNKSKETEKARDKNERGDGLKDKDKANEMGENEDQDRDRSSKAQFDKETPPSLEDVGSSADSSPDTGDKDKEDDTDKMTDSCLSAENVTHSEPGSTILKDKENVNNTEKREIDNRIVATSETNKSKETEKAGDINERGDGLKDKDKANEMGENEVQDRDTSSDAESAKETPSSLKDVDSSADSSPDTGDKDKDDKTRLPRTAENVTHSEPGSTTIEDEENVNNTEKRKIDNRIVATSETNKSKETKKARDINERGDGLKDKDKANEMGEDEDQDRDRSSDAESDKETPPSLEDVDSSADSSPDAGDKDKEDDTDKMTDSCLSAENVTHSEPGSTILEDKENVNNTEKRKIDNRIVATSETNKSKETEKARDINERGDGLQDKDKTNEMGEDEVQDRDRSSEAESKKLSTPSSEDVDSSADSSPDTGDKDKEDDTDKMTDSCLSAENVNHSEPGSTIIEDKENVNNIEKRKIDNRIVATSETNKSKETEKARDINERGDGLKDIDKTNEMGENEDQDRDRSSDAESKKLSTPSSENVDSSADSSPEAGDKDKEDDKTRLPRTAENVTHSEPGSTIIEDKENVNNSEKRKIDNRIVATSETNKSKETEKAGDINERGDGLKDKDKANEMGENEDQDRDRSSEAESAKETPSSLKDVGSSADSSPDTGDKDKEDDTDKMTDSCLSAENVTHSEPGSTIIEDKENVNNIEKRKIDVDLSADSSPDTGDKDKDDKARLPRTAENVTHSEPGSTIIEDKENVNNIEKRKIDNRIVATSETNKSKETEKARDINERGDGLKDKDKANEMGENEDQDRDRSSKAESDKETPPSSKDVGSSADSSPDTGDKDKKDDTDKMTDSCLSAENVTHSGSGSTIIEDEENVNNTEKRKIDNRIVATSETNKSKETEKAGDINERGDGLKDKDKANEMGENEDQDRDMSSEAESKKLSTPSLEESQQHKSSGFLRERQPQIRDAGNDKLIWICAAAVVLLAYVVYCKLYFSDSTPPVPKKFNVVDVFNQEMEKLQTSFPNQRTEFWRRSMIHLRRHLKTEQPTEPVSLILTSGHRAEKTLGCLAQCLAHAFSTARNSSALNINGKDKASQDSDQVKLDIDSELRNAFEGKKFAAVIHRFEELPPGSTLIFYRYCDHENAAYKDVFLAFTVMIDTEVEVPSNVSLGRVEEMVQEHVTQKFVSSDKLATFNQMDVDKLSGLWSRISHLILPVAAEEKIEHQGCGGDCGKSF